MDENHSVNAVFLTDLFIRTKKYPKLCPAWALFRHFVGTGALWQSITQATQDTVILDALKELGNSRYFGTWGTLFSRLPGTLFTGILNIFADRY